MEAQLSLWEDKYIVNGFEHPSMPVITNDNPDEIQYFQWGFLPINFETLEQANTFLGKYNTLNAKSEDIESSFLYVESFKHRRCLVLCSGFFEWKQVKKKKIPYYITLKNDEMFVFAGIWNESNDLKGNSIKSFSILTIEANELMANIHNTKKRMPLILTPEASKKWLQNDLSIEQLKSIIKPIPSSELKAHTIKKFLPAEAKNLNTADIIAYYNYPEISDIIGNTLF